jgi:hypothetical protein
MFERRDALGYSCQVFNAKPEPGTGRPLIETEGRIFRDGKPVLGALPSALQSRSGGTDGTSLATGAIALSSLEPGNYVLQLIAHDVPGKSVATQWTDFTVVR